MSDFDVFVSYCSEDVDQATELVETIKAMGFIPWFDRNCLAPGESWQDALEEAIVNIPAALVLVGGGIGPWQRREINALLRRFVEDEKPVVPVILPGAGSDPELPMFLEELMWLDLRQGLTAEFLQRLRTGIESGRPGSHELVEIPNLANASTAASGEDSFTLRFKVEAYNTLFEPSDIKVAFSVIGGAPLSYPDLTSEEYEVRVTWNAVFLAVAPIAGYELSWDELGGGLRDLVGRSEESLITRYKNRYRSVGIYFDNSTIREIVLKLQILGLFNTSGEGGLWLTAPGRAQLLRLGGA